MSRYTITDAERALRQRDEKTLSRCTIAILQQLCSKRGIQINVGGSRLLKKPFINALLTHQSDGGRDDAGNTTVEIEPPHTLQQRNERTIDEGGHDDTGQTTLKIKLPYFLPRRNKRTIDEEERVTKRQRRGEESITVHSLSTPDTVHIPHEPTLPITPDSPRMDTAVISIIGQNPAANDERRPVQASQPSEPTIPCKRSDPFFERVPRKKRKEGNYVLVRIYKQKMDLEHTNEFECALTPDGDLDLIGLSRKLNVKECKAS